MTDRGLITYLEARLAAAQRRIVDLELTWKDQHQEIATMQRRIAALEEMLRAIRDSRVTEGFTLDADNGIKYKQVHPELDDWERIQELVGPREGPEEELWEEP